MVRITRDRIVEKREALRNDDGSIRQTFSKPRARLTVEFECETAEEAAEFRRLLTKFVRGWV